MKRRALKTWIQLQRKKYFVWAVVSVVGLIFVFQNCGSTTSSIQYIGGNSSTSCTPLMNRTAASISLFTDILSVPSASLSDSFASSPASGSRRVVLDDFLTLSPYLANLTGALTASLSQSSSGKIIINGTNNSTYGLIQLNMNVGIPIPAGASKLVLSLQVLKSNQGRIVSPLVVISSSARGTQYLNLSGLTCGSTFPICDEAEDYSLTLDPTQVYTLQEIHLNTAGVAGQIHDYSILLRGLGAEIPSDLQTYTRVNGPLISHQKWQGQFTFDTPTANHLTLKTAVYPYLKDQLYRTTLGNLAVQERTVATATSSKCYGSWCVPAINAILPGTSWSSLPTSTSASAPASTTFQLTFDQTYSMNTLQMNIGNQGAPYTVQISNDQTHWTTVYNRLGGAGASMISAKMSPSTGITQNQVLSLKIVFGRPTIPDSSSLYSVSISGIQLYEDVPNLANGLAPIFNVDQTQATHLKTLQLNLDAGHDVLPFTIEGLGPGEYVLQSEISQGSTIIQSDTKHVTLIRPDRTVSDSFFGINDEFFDHQDVFVNQLKIQASRVFVNWPSLQSVAGSPQLYQWPGYNDLFQRFSTAGIKMHAVINHIPNYISSAPSGSSNASIYAPTDLLKFDSVAHNVDYRGTEFYKFVKAFVTTYHPWLSTVEIMNEFDINNCVSWKNWQGSFAGMYYDCSTGGTGTQKKYTFSVGSLANRSQEYMELLRAGYLAVKDVDPNLTVSHAGMAFIDEQTIRNLANYVYYDGHKGSEFFDVYNFHQYWANEAPEFSLVNSNTGANNNTLPFETFFKSMYTIAKTELGKKVLMTEFGYDDVFGAYTSDGLQPPSTRKEQAVFNSRALILFKKMGVTQTFPFEAIDLWSATTFFGGMGLADLKSQGKDWLAAFHLMNEQFSGFDYVKTIERAPHRIEVFKNTQGIVRAFIFKTDSTSTTEHVAITSTELAGSGVIRKLIPLLNDLDTNQNSTSLAPSVPFLNPLIVEVGPENCSTL